MLQTFYKNLKLRFQPEAASGIVIKWDGLHITYRYFKLKNFEIHFTKYFKK